MTPHTQLIKHDPENGKFGDCYRTCIASILDLEPAEVPHFYAKEGEGVEHQLAQARTWLKNQGLTVASFAWIATGFPFDDLMGVMAGNCPGVPMILSGASSAADHSVVIMDGEIVSDPSGNGIVGPLSCNQWQIDVISIGRNWDAGCRVAASHVSQAFGVLA